MINRYFFALFLLAHTAFSQSHTISGVIRDAETGQPLPFVYVFVKSNSSSVESNEYGYYSIGIPSDTIVIQFSLVGFETKSITLRALKDTRLDVEMTSKNILDEVTITADSTVLSQVGIYKIDGTLLSKTSMLLGQPDVLKSLQLLPGVQAGNEGFAAVNVRGGSPDQNLVLLDGIPVYNFYHLFGFLSTFNSDLIRDVSVLKGGIPARFGERLSSVVDISLKEGSTKSSGGAIVVSPILTQVSFESPVVKEKSSLLLGLRRTWLDALVNALSPENPLKYALYDANIKYTHAVNSNNKLIAGFFSSRDKFYSDIKAGNSNYQFQWKSSASSLRWNSIVSSKLFGSFALYNSSFKFLQSVRSRNGNNDQRRSVTSHIRETTLASDFQHYGNQHDLKFGFQTSAVLYKPEVVEVLGPDIPPAPVFESVPAVLTSFYVEDEIKLGRNLFINAGLRESIYFIKNVHYPFLQPRLKMAYGSRVGTFEIAYNRISQFVHLLSNTAISLPVDLWVPSTAAAKPEIADQISTAWSQKINMFTVSTELYYKHMRNVIEYRDGANYLYGSTNSWEEKIVSGIGRSYGAEFSVQKPKGKITGWLAYTMSKSSREFTAIDNGRSFPFKYDRRHNLSMMSNYSFDKNKSLSLIFVFSNGSWATLPTGVQQGPLPPNYQFTERSTSGGYPNDFTNQYIISQRNNYELPFYHRMDVNYQTSKTTKKANRRTWVFAIYNLYNRRNPFFLFEDKGKLKAFSLFPILPSISYKLEF